MDGEEHDENLLDGEEEEGEGVDQVKNYFAGIGRSTELNLVWMLDRTPGCSCSL